MKSMFFVEMKNNQPVAQGVVGGQVGAEHFVVRFFAPKKFTRVVSLTMMESFALFESEQELVEFVKPPAPPSDVPAGTPDKKLDSEQDKQAE